MFKIYKFIVTANVQIFFSRVNRPGFLCVDLLYVPLVNQMRAPKAL